MEFVNIKPEGVSRVNVELYKSNILSQNGKKKYIMMGDLGWRRCIFYIKSR